MEKLLRAIDTSFLSIALLFIAVTALGVVLIVKLRPNKDDEQADTQTMFSSFREMRARGEISEEEYRTIRQTLSSRLRGELDRSERTERHEERSRTPPEA